MLSTDHPDDVKADDLGSWRNDGQHKKWIKVEAKAEARDNFLQLNFAVENPNMIPALIAVTMFTIPIVISRERFHIYQVYILLSIHYT